MRISNTGREIAKNRCIRRNIWSLLIGEIMGDQTYPPVCSCPQTSLTKRSPHNPRSGKINVVEMVKSRWICVIVLQAAEVPNPAVQILILALRRRIEGTHKHADVSTKQVDDRECTVKHTNATLRCGCFLAFGYRKIR